MWYKIIFYKEWYCTKDPIILLNVIFPEETFFMHLFQSLTEFCSPFYENLIGHGINAPSSRSVCNGPFKYAIEGHLPDPSIVQLAFFNFGNVRVRGQGFNSCTGAWIDFCPANMFKCWSKKSITHIQFGSAGYRKLQLIAKFFEKF